MSDAENIWDEYVLRDFDFVGFGTGEIILDVGCGVGTQLEGLRRNGCIELGIEPDWRAVLSCRGRGLTVLQAMAEQIPLKSESLDGIICKGVIPYTNEPAAIRELARVLKRGQLAHFAHLGSGYYLRYLLVSSSWKLRCYGLRTLLNTWLYVATGLTLPGFLGDTLYQSRRRLRKYYRNNRLNLVRESPARTFLGAPVFLYHTVQKAVH